MPIWLLLKQPVKEEPTMKDITTIGLDTAKSVFQVHGVDTKGETILRRQLKRRQVLAFFAKLSRYLPQQSRGKRR